MQLNMAAKVKKKHLKYIMKNNIHKIRQLEKKTFFFHIKYFHIKKIIFLPSHSRSGIEDERELRMGLVL